MKRQYLLSFGAIALLAIAATLAWFYWPQTQLKLDSFDKVREGMTLSEIEALVGGPPGIYCSGGVTGTYCQGVPVKGVELAKEGMSREWVAESRSLFVAFDENNTATYVVTGTPVRQRRFLDRVRGWLGMDELVEFEMEPKVTPHVKY
jgi:hypothetical protein